ncbi:MAG: hypothetical protein ACRDFB_03155 [Rhabdochlamydiaceae bacterium]
MAKDSKFNINEILIRNHKRSIARAIDISIRTGTPLVVTGKNGKIVKLKPKLKYVLVPIKTRKKKKYR